MKSNDAAYTGPERRNNRITIPPCERCGSSKPVVTARSADAPLRALLGVRPRLERGAVWSEVDLRYAFSADRSRDSHNSLSINIAR